VIDVACALGFSAVEWGSGPGPAIEQPEGGSDMRQLCDRAGLLTSGLSVPDPEVTLLTPRRVAPYVRLAVSLGSPHLRLFAPSYQRQLLRKEAGLLRELVSQVTMVSGQPSRRKGATTSPASV
jgi:hypothetical protein